MIFSSNRSENPAVLPGIITTGTSGFIIEDAILRGNPYLGYFNIK